MEEARKITVLLMAYGTPEKREEVDGYLKDVFNGNKVPEEIIENVTKKYEEIGFSPLKKITLRQARLLEKHLKNDGISCTVTVGMKHWHPRIDEAAIKIKQTNPKKVIGIVAHPFRSLAGSDGYKKRFSAVFEGKDYYFIDDWYRQPALKTAWLKNIDKSRSEFGANEDIFVVFTSHGLPERVEDNLYKSQLNEFVDALCKEGGIKRYCLAYQNGEHKDWYKPEVMEKIRGLRSEGIKNVLIAPIGYITESLETLYDIDIMYVKSFENLGMKVRRVECLNESPELIDAMAEAVKSTL